MTRAQILAFAVASALLAAGAADARASRVEPTLRAPAAEVIKHRSGGDPSTSFRAPGRRASKPIALERGLTQDGGLRRFSHGVWAPRRSKLAPMHANANRVAIEHIKIRHQGLAAVPKTR